MFDKVSRHSVAVPFKKVLLSKRRVAPESSQVVDMSLREVEGTNLADPTLVEKEKICPSVTDNCPRALMEYSNDSRQFAVAAPSKVIKLPVVSWRRSISPLYVRVATWKLTRNRGATGDGEGFALKVFSILQTATSI